MSQRPPEPHAAAPLSQAQRHVLLVDDDPALRALCRSVLEAEGFRVEEARTGREALALLIGSRPHALVVDQSMPGMTGTELIGLLRKHPAFQSLPIAMLTARDDVQDRVQGLDAGADDYLVKPFASSELAARVRALVRRSERDLSADPLTRLPGNVAVREEISRRLDSGQTFHLVYADLDHFKPYVDIYGFERAAQAIELTAQALTRAVIDWGGPADFVGHVGGDDFLLVLDPDTAAAVCQAALSGFMSLVPSLYEETDRERGYVEGVDRYGTPRRFSLLGISIASIRIESGDFADRESLGVFAAKCKDEVKRRGGNRWMRFTRPSPSSEP